MNDVVIRAEGLGKRYRIGERETYRTLRDAIARAAGAPWRALSASGASAAGEGGSLWALKDVSLEVERGQVIGIIGRNGSGKSTLLKILSRITHPTLGRADLFGRVGSLLEVGTGFHPELTGRENVFLSGAILGMSQAEIRAKLDAIVDFAEVGRFLDTPVKRYSSGMQVRLAFAIAAHLEPEILLVDEVLAVGDMAFQKRCLGRMSEVTKSGRTILFVSHNMSAVSQLTERCLVLEGGQARFFGATDQAIQEYVRLQAQPRAMGRKPLGEGVCEKHMQLDPRVGIVEVGLSPRQPPQIPVGGSVCVEVLLETDRAYDELKLSYSVNDEFGGCVLSGWSPPFSTRGKGRQLEELSILSLHLAPGYYDLSVAALTGGVDRTNYTYHMVFGFGRFEVAPFLEDGTPVSDWHRGWGRIVHTESRIQTLRDRIAEA